MTRSAPRGGGALSLERCSRRRLPLSVSFVSLQAGGSVEAFNRLVLPLLVGVMVRSGRDWKLW